MRHFGEDVACPTGRGWLYTFPNLARVTFVGAGVHFSDYGIDHGVPAQGVSGGGTAAGNRSPAVCAGQRIHERIHRSRFCARGTFLFCRLEIELARDRLWELRA